MLHLESPSLQGSWRHSRRPLWWENRMRGKKEDWLEREGTCPLANQIIHILRKIRNLFNIIWQIGNPTKITNNFLLDISSSPHSNSAAWKIVSRRVREPRLSYSWQGQHISENAPGDLMGKFKWGHLLYYKSKGASPPHLPPVQFILLTLQHGK